MGEVDLLDWLVQKYRIDVRFKKWYFNIFTKCLDLAFNCHRKTKDSVELQVLCHQKLPEASVDL